jgi:hypothetical protein
MEYGDTLSSVCSNHPLDEYSDLAQQETSALGQTKRRKRASSEVRRWLDSISNHLCLPGVTFAGRIDAERIESICSILCLGNFYPLDWTLSLLLRVNRIHLASVSPKILDAAFT